MRSMAACWTRWTVAVTCVLALALGGGCFPDWQQLEEPAAHDLDIDGVLVEVDNCPDATNPDQADLDGGG